MAFAYMQKIFNAWDKEAFRAAHHQDYMFIREFEMVTLDDHIDTVDEYMCYATHGGFKFILRDLFPIYLIHGLIPKKKKGC